MSILSNHYPELNREINEPRYRQLSLEEVFANDPIARLQYERWLDELANQEPDFDPEPMTTEQLAAMPF